MDGTLGVARMQALGVSFALALASRKRTEREPDMGLGLRCLGAVCGAYKNPPGGRAASGTDIAAR